MKKKENRINIPILLCIAAFTFALFGIATTLAASPTFDITDVEIIDKSADVTGDIESFQDGKIINNITFNKVGDYVVYAITIKNNSDEEYTITSITDNSTNEYITYTYDDHKNTKINKNGHIDLQVKATYQKKLDDSSKRNQNYNVKFLITYLDKNNNKNTEEMHITNPKTNDNILESVILLIVSGTTLIALITRKKAKKTLYVLLATFMTIPISASALTVLLNFSFVNNYKLHDKLLVTVVVNDNEEKQYVDYNTKLESLETPSIEGFTFNTWKLEDGSLFDIDEPIIDDTVIIADLTAITYNIQYDLAGGSADNKTTYTTKEEFTLNNPTKTGYTFDGWTGTGLTEMTKTVKIAKGSVGNRSYEAHFTVNNYIIKFDANGGSGTMENQEMVYDRSEKLNVNHFDKDGYEFGGWNTKKDGTGDDYYDEEEVNNLMASGQIILYAQWVKAATLDTGSVLNVKMKNLANDADYYTPDYDEFTIEHIKRGKKLPSDYTPTEETTISATSSETPVYIWWDDDTKTIYWYSKAQTLFLNSDAAHMFEEMEYLKEVTILNEVDITTLEKMFAFTWQASYDGIENLDTSHVTNMRNTFQNNDFADTDLVSNWNTAEVTTMEGIFSGSNFTSVSALSSWNTSKVENMSYAFAYCYDLSDLTGLDEWDTSHVTDMTYMFDGDRNITDITPLAHFVVSKVTDMSYMFQYCYGIGDLTPLAAWNVQKVESMNGMFMGNGISSLNGIGNWLPYALENASSMFSGCSHLTDITALNNWNFTSNLKRINSLFSGCSSLSDISVLSSWQGKVYNIETTTHMFYGCTNLEDITPLYNWSLSGVNDVSYMFARCPKASGKIIIRKVIENYKSMFDQAVTAEGARVSIDYPVNPSAGYTSEEVRDFIWNYIVGKPYQYNRNISLGQAVYR